MTASYAHRSCQMGKYIMCVFVCIECIPNKWLFLCVSSQLIIKCYRLLTLWFQVNQNGPNLLTTTTNTSSLINSYVGNYQNANRMELFVRRTHVPIFLECQQQRDLLFGRKHWNDIDFNWEEYFLGFVRNSSWFSLIFIGNIEISISQNFQEPKCAESGV